MNYKYLVCYVDKSGEQASIPFYFLKHAKKCAWAIGGLILKIGDTK
jgi:hypothetical protein